MNLCRFCGCRPPVPCGADTSIIGNYTAKDGYNRGNETNASKWDEYCRDNNAVSYTFGSKEQMLASGILEKGDIIYMEPADWNHSNSDCHIGFFWGGNSSEDLFGTLPATRTEL